MTDKASPAGWVVQATIPPAVTPPSPQWIGPTVSSAPSFQYFNVAVADSDKAVEATTKHLTKANAGAGEVRAVRALSSAEIAALGLKSGEVKPA